MARNPIPDPLGRRHLLEDDLDPKKALVVAEAYVQADRPLEAIAFFQKAGAEDRLEQLARDAMEAGDVFLLREASQARGAMPDAATWRAASAAAAAAGLELYAEEARRQAERLEPAA